MNTPTKKMVSQGLASVLFTFVVAGGLHAQNRKRVDFSKLVVVGDSLAAGVENGSLEDSQQIHGFANVIAEQIGTPLALPLVPFPGAPNTLQLIGSGFPPLIEPVPAPPLALASVRENPALQATDLAVPLQTVADALNRLPSALLTTDETQLATDIVLGFPCPLLGIPCKPLTQVQQAVALRPTTIIVDIGNNDILGAVTSGHLQTMVASPATFFANFNRSYGAVMNALGTTKATVVVANLPDVMEAPYFIPVWKLAQTANFPLSEVTRALGLGPTDYVTLDALPAIEDILLKGQPGPLPVSCSATSPITPCFVTCKDAAAVRRVTIGLNEIIALQAVTHRAVVVDLFSLINELYVHGYRAHGLTLTTDFLGGLFSLDGLHPTNTGYAIMANRFIGTMNEHFKKNIPFADVQQIAATDPLLP